MIQIEDKELYIIYHSDKQPSSQTSSIYRIVKSKERGEEIITMMTNQTTILPKIHQNTNRQFVENMSDDQKRELTDKIRNYTTPEIDKDYQKLVEIGCDACNKSVYVKVGNKVVDAFTFMERLNTISRNHLSFFEFWENLDYFKNKPNIQKLLEKMERERKFEDEYTRLYNVYRLYYGSVNMFRPLLAMEYYCLYKPHTILDFTMGWGGRLVGACALNIHKYIGIDSNLRLEPLYKPLCRFLKEKSTTQIELYFQNALEMDYSTLSYDMVFTSPPYYNTEKYKHMDVFREKNDWDELFYLPLFYKTYTHLKVGGVYVLNISVEIYERVCVELLGRATHVFPMKKNNRHNKKGSVDHMDTEYIYVWVK